MNPVAKKDVQSTHLRLPKSLWIALRQKATDEEISINTLIATLLAGAIGFDLTEKRET